MSEKKSIDAAAAFAFISEKNPIFRHASRECFVRNAGNVIEEIIYSPGETIASPADVSEEPCIGTVLSGNAAVYSGDGGRRVLLRMLGSGGVYGVATLFSDAPAPTLIKANTYCAVLRLPRDAFRAMLHEDGDLLDAYLGFLSERILFLNCKIACVTGGSAERRLALHLLSLTDTSHTAPDDAVTATIPVSFTELSRLLDIGRASLYRAFDSLDASGAAIRGTDHTIKIYPAKLSAIAGYDY